MKTIKLIKTLNFKRALVVAALFLAALGYAKPGQAMPHIIDFDFHLLSAPGECSASIYDVAAKHSSCTLKARAKAARSGRQPNFAACEAKVFRWAKKSVKACCSVLDGDPAAHEACLESLDAAIVNTSGTNYCLENWCVAPGEGSCDGGGDNHHEGLGGSFSPGGDIHSRPR